MVEQIKASLIFLQIGYRVKLVGKIILEVQGEETVSWGVPPTLGPRIHL